jgi:hypothetical protein
MSRRLRTVSFAVLSVLWCGVSASAETLRCQSVNGNLNCAGSGGVSCQTVNGRKVCVSNGGGVVQSFGDHTSSNSPDDGAGADDEGAGSENPAPATRQRLERHDPGGHSLLLDRSGQKLHLRTDWLSIDRD